MGGGRRGGGGGKGRVWVDTVEDNRRLGEQEEAEGKAERRRRGMGWKGSE